jgi:hypothetical protein
MVADRHHRDDLAPVQKQGQRPLHDDGGLDLPPLMIYAGDGAGQSRIIGLRADREFLHELMMGSGTFRDKPAISMCRDIKGIEGSRYGGTEIAL